MRFSVKAKHWERSVRLANIGFTKERVNKQLRQNAENRYRLFTLEYKPPYRPKRFPLEDELRRLDFAIDHSYDAAAVLVDTVFYLVITVIRIVAELADVMLLSPDLRAAEKDLKELIADYHFLQEQDIHTVSDLQANVARQSEVQKLKQSLATSERRIKMIDKAIEELFEANISGKVSDERFVKMTDNYEKEQKELLELVADGNKKLQDAEQNKVDLKLLMKALRDYTDIRQLTPEIVNALIRRIEVHSKDKKTKKVKVDIYLTAVGLFTPPTEQELQMAMEEIRRNPQQFGISA